MDGKPISTRAYALTLAAIVALALALRLVGFGSIPPGLYHDEAYNGLDALRVLQGEHPLWFTANNGREPLFIYLVALSIAFFGRTVVAVRAPALLLGLLAVPATAFMGSSFFNRRVGLLAAAVTAVTLWPIHLSRVGFRAVGLPLFVALALGFLWRGLRDGRRRDLVAAGLCYGLSFYTYLAARFTPVPLVGLALLMLWPAARLPRPTWRRMALFALVAAVTLAPLAGCMLLHPEILTGRADQVSVFSPAISHGDPWGTLVRHVGLALEAFFIRGDRIPRHNLPWRPIFDPALALAFVAGIVVAARRRGAGWFALLWVATMLVPTILAEDTPHFLRAVGMLPVLFLLPALGLDAAWRQLERAGRPALGAGLAGLILLVGLGSTSEAYFRRYANAETVYYHFEAGSTELAQEIRQFLTGGSSRVAYVSQQLWQTWPSMRFLLPESPALHVIAVDSPPAPGPAPEAMLAVWPVESYREALSLLPAGATVSVRDDLRERGDLEPEARQLALLFTATAGQAGAPQATLEGGIHLSEAEVSADAAQRLRVRLVWQADEPAGIDYTVFVQVLRDGAVLGQDDSQPADGCLPATLWQPGQRIVDVHDVDLPAAYNPQTDRVIVGMYDLSTMQRLRVLDAAASLGEDAILLDTQ